MAGGNATAGRVEGEYPDGQWGTVCDDHWGMDDARVICRQLDLGEPIAVTKKAHFGQGAGGSDGARAQGWDVAYRFLLVYMKSGRVDKID